MNPTNLRNPMKMSNIYHLTSAIFLYFLLLTSYFLPLLCGCVRYPNIPKIEKIEKTGNPLPQSAKDYVLGPEDILNIMIWDHEDLTRTVEISREGEFTYPLIGKVHADGLTVSQLEKEITERLSGRYIINPQVTVTVKEYHRFFYVFGEVKKPGRYPLEMGTTVLKAITTAGGATDKAAINKTKIVREEEGVRKELKAKMGDIIQPEDVIIVPESFF